MIGELYTVTYSCGSGKPDVLDAVTVSGQAARPAAACAFPIGPVIFRQAFAYRVTDGAFGSE